MSKTRCFVAIELPDGVRVRLSEISRVLAAKAQPWRDEKWVAEDNLHITLKFLGNLDEVQLAGLRGELAAALAGVRGFALGLSGLRAVPGARRCSMIWARFSDSDGQCGNLAARVDAAALACGLPAEKRAFTPHVTLVRARRPRRLADAALTSANAMAPTPPISMSVLSVTLLASTLTPGGPIYEEIDSWTLSGTA